MVAGYWKATHTRRIVFEHTADFPVVFVLQFELPLDMVHCSIPATYSPVIIMLYSQEHTVATTKDVDWGLRQVGRKACTDVGCAIASLCLLLARTGRLVEY